MIGRLAFTEMSSAARTLILISLNFCLTQFCLAEVSPLFTGKWKTPCDRGLRKEQVIEGDVVTTTELFHQDKFCTQESFRFKTAGIVTFDREQPQWINFTYGKIELTVFVQAVAEDFNTRSVCGFHNWQAGVSQEITGLKCALFNVNKPTQIPPAGTLGFGIYKIEEDKLHYGQLTLEKNGSSADRRPDTFSLEVYSPEQTQ